MLLAAATSCRGNRTGSDSAAPSYNVPDASTGGRWWATSVAGSAAAIAVDRPGFSVIGGSGLRLGPAELGARDGGSTWAFDALARVAPDGRFVWGQRLERVEVADVAVDARGRVYLVGKFYLHANVGAKELIAETRYAGLIASFDSHGDLSWTRVLSGLSSWGELAAIASSADGAIAVCGSYRSSGITAGGKTLTGPSRSNLAALVVALASDGRIVWARSGGGESSDRCTDIAVSADGATFAATTSSHRWRMSGKSYDVEGPVIGRLDIAGRMRWLKGGHLASDGGGTDALALAADGTTYASGWFKGGLELGASKLDARGARALFVSAWATDGTPRWVRKLQPKSGETVRGTGIAAGSAGTYLVGYGQGGLAAGSELLRLTETTERDAVGGFVVAHDPKGRWRWGEVLGGDGKHYLRDIAVGSQGELFIGGTFTGTLYAGADRLVGGERNTAFVWKRRAAPAR